MAVFHQIWTSEGPNVVKILSARVSDPFPVTFPGGKFWYHVKKKLARFWARREARFAICPFFLRKIIFSTRLVFEPSRTAKKAAKRTRASFRSCSSALAALVQLSTRARDPERDGANRPPTLVPFSAHSPPTRRRSWLMPRGTTPAQPTTDAAVLPAL